MVYAVTARLLAVLSLVAVVRCRTPPHDGLGVPPSPLVGGDAAAAALWSRLASSLQGSSYDAVGGGVHPAVDWTGSNDDRTAGHDAPSFESLLAAIGGLYPDRLPESEEGAPTAQPPAQRRKQATYCNPPNPCPKGKTAATDRCQEGVPDTEEFNRMYILRQMELGTCPCDSEHNSERSCPTSPDYEVLPGTKKVDWTRIDAMLRDKASSAPGEVDLRKIAAELNAGKRHDQGSPLSSEVTDYHGEQLEVSPYARGSELARAAKKSPLAL